MMLVDTVALKAAEKIEATMGHRAAFAAYRTAVLGVQSLEARRTAILGAGRAAMVLAREDAEPLNTVMGWWPSMAAGSTETALHDEIYAHAVAWAKELVRRALETPSQPEPAKSLAMGLVRAEWRRTKTADAAYLGARVFEALAMFEDAERWCQRTLDTLDASQIPDNAPEDRRQRQSSLRRASMIQLARLGKRRGDPTTFARWKRVAEDSGAPQDAKEQAAAELLCSESKYDRTLALSILLEAKVALHAPWWFAVVRWASWATPHTPMELEKGVALAAKLPEDTAIRNLLEASLRREQDVPKVPQIQPELHAMEIRELLESMKSLVVAGDALKDDESLTRTLEHLQIALRGGEGANAWSLLDVPPCALELLALLADRPHAPKASELANELVHRVIELGCVYNDEAFSQIAERLGRTARIALFSALVQRGRRQWRQPLQNDLYAEAVSHEREGKSIDALDLLERVKLLAPSAIDP
ncbi:MAG: hypothetical protein KBF88_14005, partial [Polyangiaceae bacterium]|nr:hypothetical protein [Polyangiaceae bacterium]